MPASEHEELRVFVAKLALVVLPVLSFLGWVEFQLRRMPNAYSVKKAVLERQAADADVLILGNSQALEGIDPSCISDAAINAAGASQSLHYDAALVDRYLPRMNRLKLVVVSLSYFSLRYRLEASDPWRAFFYRHYFGIAEESVPQLRWRMRDHLFVANYGIRRSIAFARSGFRNDPGIDARGWVPHAIPVGTIGETDGKKRADAHTAAMLRWRPDENIRLLEAMIQRLRARRVSVVLVTMPVLATYSRYMDRQLHAELLAETSALARRNNVVFRDYLEDSRFEWADFADNDHLNARGARRFTTLLVHEVLNGLPSLEQMGAP